MKAKIPQQHFTTVDNLMEGRGPESLVLGSEFEEDMKSHSIHRIKPMMGKRENAE